MKHIRSCQIVPVKQVLHVLFFLISISSTVHAHDNINVHPYIVEQAFKVWPKSGTDAYNEMSQYLGAGYRDPHKWWDLRGYEPIIFCNDAKNGTRITEGAKEEDDYDPVTDLCNISTETLWYWHGYKHHFYDPDLPDPNNGLDNYTGALARAQVYWIRAINLYNDPDSEKKAEAYWYLGRLAHLLADVSVPAHVLRDPHGPGDKDSYEDYMAENEHYKSWDASDAVFLSFYYPLNFDITLDNLFKNLAQRAQFFPSDDVLGNRDNTDPAWFDDSWPANSSDMRTCVLGYCYIDGDNCRRMGNKLMPLAIQYTAELYKYFWREVHDSSSTCPPPGYPDYTVDCGDGTCCPYLYPVCCSDGMCYMYESDCNSDTGCPSDYPIDCLNGWCCPLDYPICGTGSETGQCFECLSEIAMGNDQVKLASLRKFRNDVLSHTPEGRELIKLYYQLSPAIVKAMNDDESFKEWVKGIIDGVLPMIEEALK